MNKVFSCAGDLNIKIYYQDTDSTHLNYDDVDKVVERYKDKYGLELVGEALGNFHVDFDMNGANSEIYAVESLFLGKKTYIDILESIDKGGKAINSEHIRMKGIPTSCIQHYAKQHNISVSDIYKKLYNNEVIKLDLANDGNKFVCRNNKTIQYQMYQISLEDANTSEMKVISSLLIKSRFISLIIYNGRSYKTSVNLISVLLMKPIKEQ